MKNLLIKIALASIIIGVVLWGFYSYIIFKQWQLHGYSWAFVSGNVYEQLSDNIGDFMWGTLGIAFTFTATLFLFITFREQREQLRVTKEQSDKARFETTYFNILGMLKQVQDTVNANIGSNYNHTNARNLIEYYNNFRDSYRNHLNSDNNLAAFTSSFVPVSANIASIEQLQGLLAVEYESYIESIDCNVGYMYRYIFNTIKFVIDDEYNKNDVKLRDRYLNLSLIHI